MNTFDQQRRLWRRATAALALAAVAALAFPLASQAGSGSFTDVGPSNIFFANIEEVADAGVAGGYPDGTYKPSAPVTRQAMAAFLSRAGSSAGQVSGASLLSNITSTSFANTRTIAVDVPGDATTQQRVHITGLVGLFDGSPVGCAPCTIALQITGTGSEGSSTERHYTVVPTAFDDAIDTLQIEHLFVVPGGVHSFQVRARWVSGTGAVDVAISSSTAIATVVPFSSFPAA
jgi:hypothetical protein